MKEAMRQATLAAQILVGLVGAWGAVLLAEGVRRRNGRCGGGFGGGGGDGGARAAVETKQLGYHEQGPEEALAPHAWELGNGLGPRVTWRSLLWFNLLTELSMMRWTARVKSLRG